MQVCRCETPTLPANRRSSIIEEILTLDSSLRLWLLDIISEDENMVKGSVHFVLSENQLIRVVAYTFDVQESKVQLSMEDEGCCDQIDAYTKTEDDALLLLKADKSELIDAYSKTEADALFNDKLNISDQFDAHSKKEDDTLFLLKVDKTKLIDSYSKTDSDTILDDKLSIFVQIYTFTKQEDDALLFLKANKTELIDTYNKTEAEVLLDDKLNISDQIDAFTKQEGDAMLLLKANKTDLDKNVDLTSTQATIGQKQFEIISVCCISKQNKNDVSILLAGGGDMLVSSLISHPQLQEVRDITSVDKQVMDYRQDGTGLRALETELPNMSNVITIHGTATGGDNAITDLSFNGNILISVKNS
ncbi:MAG: hypothetical protein EZS28_003738 [Streblomastix strix]|uniref:Uncharacterized protein n=1 Tax=Streblomastix strix TaxID=222440 RepID=A0A5J4X249_9EUKA|nr:MAG: hypothetical protein EZS28_003738 [Streblomastix strix]